MNTPELCLGALLLGDASGYEIKRRFETIFSHFQQASFAAIYPALARLEEKGLVTAQTQVQDKRPAKKTYHITDAGRQHFIDALHQSKGDEVYRSDFVLQMFFAERLRSDKLATALDDQARRLRQSIEQLEQSRQHDGLTKGQRFTLDYGLAVNRAALAFIEAHEGDLTDSEAPS